MSDGAAARRRPLVLVVDDVPDGLEVCSQLLQFRGFDVATATDGVEAMERTQELLPDVVLMDISLPRMDGLEATRRLKKDPRTSAIPILAVTAHALDSARLEALAAGCSDVVTKPFGAREIEEAIRRQLPAPAADDDMEPGDRGGTT